MNGPMHGSVVAKTGLIKGSICLSGYLIRGSDAPPCSPFWQTTPPWTLTLFEKAFEKRSLRYCGRFGGIWVNLGGGCRYRRRC